MGATLPAHRVCDDGNRSGKEEEKPAARSPPSTAQPATAPASRLPTTVRHAATSFAGALAFASAADATRNSGIGRVDADGASAASAVVVVGGVFESP